MPLGALLGLLWPAAPTDPPPDVLIAVDEPGAEVVITRRLTNRSKRIAIEVWKDARVVVNGAVR